MPTRSDARGGAPRTVPDPDAQLHRDAARRQRAYNEAQERQIAQRSAPASGPIFPNVGHPGVLESMIPVWGAGREALADAHDGEYAQAIGNAVMAATDFVPAKAMGAGLLRGAVKVRGPHVWRTKPWERAEGAREWMGRIGHLRPGEHGHHWLIPQGGWGKHVPDFIKNQPWNAYGREPVVHGRIHGRYTVDGQKLPRYGSVERVVRGTPPWAATGVVTTPAGVGRASESNSRGRQRKANEP